MTNAVSMAATVAFAVTAVLAIRRETDVDIVGATTLGLITAVGGGTVRDVILDVPVFWAGDLSYIRVSVASAIAAQNDAFVGVTKYGLGNAWGGREQHPAPSVFADWAPFDLKALWG